MRHILNWQRKWKRLLRLTLFLSILIIACSELADWIACNIATTPPNGKSCVVLVLGYPSNSDGTSNHVQEGRVATGIAAYRHYNCDRLVFSGAAVKNQIVEAQTMAQLARGSGIQSDRISLETQARTTWENIKFAIPSLEKYDRVMMASDSLHAHRGRRYLCKQRPNLCTRTFVTVAYRPFERSWWKIVSACYELFAWGRDLIMF
jgi:vancomycin permeability regulator SanA